LSRLLGLALLAGALVLAGATPAAAHAGGPEPGDWLAVVDEVSPAMPGVTFRLVDRGEEVELTNTGAELVTVLGYDGEPYLRIGPGGVAENARSAATYLNRTRDSHAPVPDSARDPAAPPQWRPVSSRPSWRWHDHRTHWMQDGLPPSVVHRPNGTDTVEVARFQLDFRQGDTPATVGGRLLWVAPPPAWPWAAGGVLLLAIGIAAGGLRRWRPAAAVLLGALLATDLAHAVAEGSVTGALPSAAGWALGVLTLAGLARGAGWSPYTLAMTGALLAVVDGLGDVSALLHSQLPGAGPPRLARAATTVAFGLGLGLLGTGWRVWRRQHPLPVPQPAESPACG
jgi:hypothetical protein